ncbi:MAG: hypothetical protein P1U40_08275 [Coxiellaceae bacterium]|nr:hypothetical protein [Coxiellaceae bacterium]
MQYPTRPKAVTTAIILLAIVTIAYCFYFLFAPNLIPGEQLGSYRYNAVFALYVMFLFLFGFCTGRRWVLNLFVVLSIISIAASLAVSFLASFSVMLWVAMAVIALKLIIALSLYGRSTSNWFAECKQLRVKRANAGINGGAIVWIACITCFIFIFWAGFFAASFKNIIIKKSFVGSSAVSSSASASICRHFLKNPKLAPRMKVANIDQARCEKLMPRQINRCVKYLSPSMPKNMKNADYLHWMRKVGQCSGRLFYKKYLAHPKRHRSMI